MSNLNPNTSKSCTCTHGLDGKRRRRRRNYSYYRAASMIELRTIVREGLPDLYDSLFPSDVKAASQSSCAPTDSDHHEEQVTESESHDIVIPINCPVRTADEALVAIHGAFYFHIRSKINLGKKILKKQQAKNIIHEQCLHYSRACKVALVNYSIQDDHFHMLIAVTSDSYAVAREKASKMIGCIKQQFTKRFKAWFNEIYVRERKFRIQPIPRGSLWDARAEIEFIANETELMSCVLYIESNYLKIRAASEIKTLETPPPQINRDDHAEHVDSPYQALKNYLAAHQFQSAGWYVGGRRGHTTALSDGTDGVWLTGRQLEYWWNKPVKKYPPGWRKVWFKKGGGILVVTPDKKRRYHENPVLNLLDAKPVECGRIFRYLVLAACWHNRSRVWVSNSSPAAQDEPGMTEI